MIFVFANEKGFQLNGQHGILRLNEQHELYRV